MFLTALYGAAPAAFAAEDPSAPKLKPLENVVVEAQKLSVETKIDRKVYTVTEDALSTFGSLSDILSVIPSIDIDPDGILSLRGDTNVLILIDGKPSTQFQGSKAGDNLQSLAASEIERIEVLTTPPPQFKAEGAAGVINIITRKRGGVGPSGSVQASKGLQGRSVLGGDGSYGTKRLSESLTAGYREDFRERTIHSEVIGPDPVTGQVLQSDYQLSERLRRNVPSVGFSAAYNPNDSQALTGSASWSRRGGLRSYTQLDESTNAAADVVSSTRRLSSGHDPENDYDASLQFTQKFPAKGQALDLILHRSVSHQHEHYDYTNDSFLPPTATFFTDLDFHEDHGITGADVDYSLSVSAAGSFKLGYAFEEDDYGFANIGGRFDPTTGAQSVDPMLTNDFQFRQDVHAIYQSYQGSVGKWSWLGGLRTELTRSTARQLTSNVSFPNDYTRLYPSLHVDRSLSDAATLSVGFSRRVARPNPSYLNPYLDHEYTPNLRAGNPHLQPQDTRSFDLGYSYEQRGSTLGLTAYYRRNTDTVTDVTEYLGNGLSLTTKTNLPRNDSAGLEFTAAGHLLPGLTYSLSGNAFYSQIDATALGYAGLRSTTGLNAKGKLDYHPTRNDSIQFTVTRTDKRLTPQGSISAMNVVNFGYHRALSPDLSLVATVSDLFNGQRYERTAVTPTFTQIYERSVRGRVAYIGLTYSFGGKKKDKQPNFDYEPDG